MGRSRDPAGIYQAGIFSATLPATRSHFTMASLTDKVKREIGQHFVFGFHGSELSDEIRTLIRDYHLGCVILMKRNVRDVQQVRRIIRELQQFAKECGHDNPLLIGIDQENGLVSAFSTPMAGTQFPGAMALAATGSVDLAKEVSAASAKELKMVGINWAYSPVADINSDSRNPVIGVRSFGDDPTMVADYAASVSHGLTSEGVAPCAKHFPGHGDTHVDSHLALPRILKSKAELEKMELVPFKKLIDAKIASIMIGHMALPLLTGDDAPASTSAIVNTKLLRREFAYEGVVVTDCMEMDAIPDVEESAVRSLVAGVDIVMACHTYERQVGAINKVYEAVEAGRLALDMLEEGGRRIAMMKNKFVGGWKDVLGKDDEEAFEREWRKVKEINMRLSTKAYRKSCTIVWGSEILPLKILGKEVILFTPEMEGLNRAVDDADGVLRDGAGRLRNTAGASYVALGKEVEKKGKTRHVVYSRDEEEVEDITEEVGVVIFVLRNADQSVWQLGYMKKVLEKRQDIPMVIVASCGPYDLRSRGQNEIGKSRTVYVASFEFTREALGAVVQVVFEGGGGTGRMPVVM